MERNFIHSLVNRASVALVFAATALSVSASQKVVPEAFNVLGGLNGLGKDMCLSIVAHMAEREDITSQDISSFITTSKRMSKIPKELSKKDKWKNLFAVVDKARNKGRMARHPEIFSRFYDLWQNKIATDIMDAQNPDVVVVAYDAFHTYIMQEKKKKLDSLLKSNDELEEILKCKDPNKPTYVNPNRWPDWERQFGKRPPALWKERYSEDHLDLWMEEDNETFDAVIFGEISSEQLVGAASNFMNTIRAIVGGYPDFLTMLYGNSVPFRPFLLELYFEKIGRDIADEIHGISLIFLSVMYKRIEVLDFCLQKGIDVNTHAATGPFMGQTPLMAAADSDQMNMVYFLLLHRARIDEPAGSPDYGPYCKGYTALMFAAQEGHHKMVRYLLKCGANPYLIDVNGENALDHAKWYSRRYGLLGGTDTERILREWMDTHPKSFYSAE